MSRPLLPTHQQNNDIRPLASAFQEEQPGRVSTTSTGQPDHKLFGLALAGVRINTHKQLEAIIAAAVACAVHTVALKIAPCVHPVTFIFGICDSIAEYGCILYL